MADVNFKEGRVPVNREAGIRKAPLASPLSADERPEIPYIELLFFAYRDFISDPDAALKTLSPAERAGAERFLRLMIDEGERDKVARLIGR